MQFIHNHIAEGIVPCCPNTENGETEEKNTPNISNLPIKLCDQLCEVEKTNRNN